jgi:hypothetical protein
MGAANKKETQAVGHLAFWAGIILAPLVWFAQMEVKYALTPWVCTTNNHIVMHAISALAMLISAGAALLAWSAWKKLGNGIPGQTKDQIARYRFMTISGIALSCMFFLVILAQEIPNIMVGPCLPG